VREAVRRPPAPKPKVHGKIAAAAYASVFPPKAAKQWRGFRVGPSAETGGVLRTVLRPTPSRRFAGPPALGAFGASKVERGRTESTASRDRCDTNCPDHQARRQQETNVRSTREATPQRRDNYPIRRRPEQRRVSTADLQALLKTHRRSSVIIPTEDAHPHPKSSGNPAFAAKILG